MCASPSPTSAKAAVKRHVDFLSTLYVTWGAIFALVAVAGFVLAAGAFAIAQSTGPVRFGSEMAARLTGVTISIVSVIALVWAVLHIVTGRMLKRYRPSARLMTLGLAIGNLILIPFGTALGAYALWALLKDEGRRLFEP
jgi:threonine/homoserine efflux transporter RhtA